VSEATVKSHLAHIYAKLDVDSRTGAVSRAIEQRIIRR
jgi:DNA-binding NarL/FixJ family response regulator